MTDLNAIQLGGRLTKDAVLEIKGELKLCNFSMAVNRSVKKKDSEDYEDKPVFVDMTIFGNYAESMVKHLTKGRYITVKGHLDMDSWTSADGKKNQRLKVVPEQGEINPWVERIAKAAGEEEAVQNNETAPATDGYPIS